MKHLLQRPLGSLNYMKIRHDNSGKGDFASWYLKHIIVNDLQTNEKYYFICEKWMAVELWLSIFNRPIYSSFKRLDRVTCGFVFIYISMLLNILYYQKNSSSVEYSTIDFVIFKISTEQVKFKQYILSFNLN